MATLVTYRTQVRRLLHDANGAFFSNTDLNDYINEARLHLAGDSGCNRRLQNFTLLSNIERYEYTDLPDPSNVIDIWGITVQWGNTRYAMQKWSYTRLNAQLRPYVSYTSTPMAFAGYGESAFVVGPLPSQDFPCEVDTMVYPGDLTNDGQVDDIPLVFQTCIKYRAAYLAKYQEQDSAEGEMMMKMYWRALKEQRVARALRTIPNPYAIGNGSSWGDR